MKNKITLEYVFSSSLKVLFTRLSTYTGLAEWFADDVYRDGNKLVFVWDKEKNEAEILECKPNSYIRFHWVDSDDENDYFEFRLNLHQLTGDVALLITDFVDAGEEESATDLWNNQIERLRRNLGA